MLVVCNLSLQNRTALLTLWSGILAVEVHGRSQVATASFQNIPKPLQAVQTGHPWRVVLPASSENRSARSQYIVLDGGFLGITTLYAPPPEDHKFE